MNYKEKVIALLNSQELSKEQKGKLEGIFPELAESEDEKTKRILHSISSKISFHLRDIFTEEEFQCFDARSNAWLEKQAEKEIDGEDYGIDGLWHAQRILEKTLGSVDGYQTDDGILEHKAAITAVKKLYGQKPAEWNEEDESMRTRCIGVLGKCYMGELPTKVEEELNWLKSLKERIQPQSTWKPSDEQMNNK